MSDENDSAIDELAEALDEATTEIAALREKLRLAEEARDAALQLCARSLDAICAWSTGVNDQLIADLKAASIAR